MAVLAFVRITLFMQCNDIVWGWIKINRHWPWAMGHCPYPVNEDGPSMLWGYRRPIQIGQMIWTIPSARTISPSDPHVLLLSLIESVFHFDISIRSNSVLFDQVENDSPIKNNNVKKKLNDSKDNRLQKSLPIRLFNSKLIFSP